MSRWKPLPADLEPPNRELIIRLRELKDQTGMSAAGMARKTTYSKSSWDRYLNGVTQPPGEAVAALGRLANADPVRLLTLWELAEQSRTAPAGDVAYLTSRLRDLKERTGLSLVGLAGKTPYSKSSWNRYLNGAVLPPRQAVEDLARLAGEPPARLLVLRERVEATRSGRAATPRVKASPPRPPRWTITFLRRVIGLLTAGPLATKPSAEDQHISARN
jgi:transcriptional regulator with XRE-family HTH domain